MVLFNISKINANCGDRTTKNALSIGKQRCKYPVCIPFEEKVGIPSIEFINAEDGILPQQFNNLFPYDLRNTDGSGATFKTMSDVWTFTPKVSGDVYVFLSCNYFTANEDEKVVSINICEGADVNISGTNTDMYDLSGTSILFNSLYPLLTYGHYAYENFNNGTNIILHCLNHDTRYCIKVTTIYDDVRLKVDVGIALFDRCSNTLELLDNEQREYTYE